MHYIQNFVSSHSGFLSSLQATLAAAVSQSSEHTNNSSPPSGLWLSGMKILINPVSLSSELLNFSDLSAVWDEVEGKDDGNIRKKNSE